MLIRMCAGGFEAVDRMSGEAVGRLLISREENSIVSFIAETGAERLLTVAIRQLSGEKPIRARASGKAADALINKGFVNEGDVFIRAADNIERGRSFHYRLDKYLNMSKIENCPCRLGVIERAGEIYIEMSGSTLCLERAAQGRLFGKCYVVIRNHYVNFEDIPSKEMALFMEDVQKCGSALKAVTGAVKINYEIHSNTGPHIHCHLFPRYLDDDFPSAPIDYRVTEPSPYESEAEFEQFVNDMRRYLSKSINPSPRG